ncbi:hypothetical protein [Dictyobacter arantiisoli]|uniref:Lipoprotein n=1 Tax=Dictyobacter arantiisoli TaxID=2014874 RepID=A0A5A5TKR4_9CHLR|nr:hypothetical protein [Dictyobacter arantiisoli]GCF11865.1 hypothetical protein KDI_54290 [Dictyobacter arantiisoli]
MRSSSGLLILLLFLTACGPIINERKTISRITVNKAFQKTIPGIPDIPKYLCGAWASTNAPGPYSSITIYARLTQNLMPLEGAQAHATVHFAYGDAKLDQAPVSDVGGYVSFYLALQGQQPRMSAATVDITFNAPGKTVHCSQAFFTPQ